MLVFDEQGQIESILQSKEKPNKMGMKSFIRYIAMYYYEQYADSPIEEYIHKIQEIIDAFSFPLYVYEESRYFRYIAKLCMKIRSGIVNAKLRDNSPITITEAEIDVIKQAPTEKHQKVMFTLYVMAKKIIPKTGWVNFSLRDIFTYANVYVDQNKKYEMLYELNQMGLIEVNHIVDKQGYKVCLHEDSPAAITITDFVSLGNQYLGKYKDGWMDCQRCHRMIKKKSSHDYSRKYCKCCGEEVDREKARQRMSTLRGKRSKASIAETY